MYKAFGVTAPRSAAAQRAAAGDAPAHASKVFCPLKTLAVTMLLACVVSDLPPTVARSVLAARHTSEAVMRIHVMGARVALAFAAGAIVVGDGTIGA